MYATVQAAAARMAENNLVWLPVNGPSGIVGVVSAGDIVRRSASLGSSLTEHQVSEVMTLGVIYCRDSDTIMTALQLMQRHLIHQLGVLDASECMTGIVTIHDLVAAILNPESAEE